MTGRHRRPPRHNGTGRHRASRSGPQAAARWTALLVTAVVLGGGLWATTSVGYTAPPAPAATAVPEPLPLGSALPTVPVIPSTAPDTGGGPASGGETGLSSPEEKETPDSVTPTPGLASPPFSRDCPIVNFGEDVEPPVREVACFLYDEFPDTWLMLGRGPRVEEGTGHEDGLAVDFFIEGPQLDELCTCAQQHRKDWHLDDVQAPRNDPDDPGYVHLEFNAAAQTLPPRNLTC